MKNRTLNPEEKTQYLKALERNETEIEYQKYLLKYTTLMLSEGLLQNYRLQTKEYENKLAQTTERLNTLSEQTETMEKHLKEGVPTKEVK